MRISTIIGYFKCFIHQTYLYHNYPSYICQPPIPIRLKSQSLIGIKLTHLRETYLHPTVIPSNPTFKAISTKATTYLYPTWLYWSHQCVRPLSITLFVPLPSPWNQSLSSPSDSGVSTYHFPIEQRSCERSVGWWLEVTQFPIPIGNWAELGIIRLRKRWVKHG